MAVQKLALAFALACFLLLGLFLMGEATGPRCKSKQVRERQPTFQTLHWQEASLPLAVIVGGCCGLVWWVLLVIYDVSQKGGQKGLPQISGDVELEEQKTTAPDHLEEWTEAGIKLDCKAAIQGNLPPQGESGPCPPSQPKEQGPTTFWAYLEQELERILLAIRSHKSTGQTPVAEEQTNTSVPAEKPSPVPGDWQNFLAHIKQYVLTTDREGSQAADKQHLSPGEGPSSQAVEKQHPLPEEGQSSPAKDEQSPRSGKRQSPPSRKRQSPPSRKRQSPPARQRKKSPNRTRSRSKRKSSPSSRSRGGSSGRRRPCLCSKHK